MQIGDQVLDLLLVLDARKGHLGSRNLRLRILDVLGKRRFVPGDPGRLVGLRIVEAFDRAGLAANQAVQCRTNRILGVVADLMAGLATAKTFSPSAASCAKPGPAPIAS